VPPVEATTVAVPPACRQVDVGATTEQSGLAGQSNRGPSSGQEAAVALGTAADNPRCSQSEATTVGKPARTALRAIRAASASSIDWAQLLKRVYDVNALACPCGGRLRFIALILEPEPPRLILRSLRLPDEPPPIARARSTDFSHPRAPDA